MHSVDWRSFTCAHCDWRPDAATDMEAERQVNQHVASHQPMSAKPARPYTATRFVIAAGITYVGATHPTCAVKVRHASLQSAQAHADGETSRLGVPVTVYVCPHCCEFHVGTLAEFTI